jgi:hypothetical protein
VGYPVDVVVRPRGAPGAAPKVPGGQSRVVLHLGRSVVALGGGNGMSHQSIPGSGPPVLVDSHPDDLPARRRRILLRCLWALRLLM